MFNVENSLGFLLAKSYQRGWSLFKEKLEPWDMTPPQFALLAFLWQQDGLSQVELSEKSQVDRTTVGGLIDRLERNGIVQRQPHPKDRRAYQIRLTPKGRALEPVLIEAARGATEQFTTGLSVKEIKELTRMLGILRGERIIYEKATY
ncbi:MarR family winged helix-turn-helix transcriptional regulator [Pelotalea chapellei]|uniref:MarR family transcriptional regulator n=1 Tax=Pelotalea chapellei TaxID=44671 RepID=A0ABS5UBM1_9BACT|nr:MarR family transcriptional regulator [Pelotalea chapellei]MBT1073080.1 MarR family transcriptional regulator [Pelotalea chapellei]